MSKCENANEIILQFLLDIFRSMRECEIEDFLNKLGKSKHKWATWLTAT